MRVICKNSKDCRSIDCRHRVVHNWIDECGDDSHDCKGTCKKITTIFCNHCGKEVTSQNPPRGNHRTTDKTNWENFTRICIECNTWLPFHNFYKYPDGRPHSRCIPCTKLKDAKRYEAVRNTK